MIEFSEVYTFLIENGLSRNALFNRWTFTQVAIIAAAFLIAKFVTRILDEPIREQLRKIEGQRDLLRLLVMFNKRLVWLLAAAILWLSYIILLEFTWLSNTYLLRMATGLVSAWFVISLLSKLIRNRTLSRTLAVIGWSVAAIYILGFLPETMAALDSASLSVGTVRLSLLTLAKSVFLFSILIWLALMLSQFVTNTLAKNEDISPSVKVLLSKVLRFMLLLLAVLISLGAVGIDFTALAVFSGAVGIGIGLGLQKIVSNFISGIILLLDKSIKPGDVIEIETVSGSTYGWVQHLGARYTAVRTRDGTETLIPNETFIDTPVTNWTHTNKAVRRKLPIGVSYGTDVEKAIKLCLDAVSDIPRVLKVPKAVCLVKGFGDSSVDLELRFWINDPEDGVANVSSLAYLEVWKRFQQNNIEIPFPQRDLNIRSSVPLEVNTTGKTIRQTTRK